MKRWVTPACGRSECSCRLHFNTGVNSAVATELIYLHFHTPPFYLFFLLSFLTPKSVRFLLSFSPMMSSSSISSASKKRRTEDSLAAGYLFQQTFIFDPTFWIFFMHLLTKLPTGSVVPLRTLVQSSTTLSIRGSF